MYKNFLRIVISGRALNVIFRRLSNVIFGFIPRIHAKHYSLDTRVTPEYDGDLMVDSRVTPEYDNGKRMCFVSENDNLVAQCGRSMIEMLGVLAIIGVLSVGGIAGYSKAMMKFKINKTAEQISQIVTNIRTLYLQQKDYNGLGNSSAIQMGAIPDDLTIDSSGNIKNIFGGTIWIHTSTSSYAWHNSVGDTDDAFIITIYNLPKEACVALATMDWGTSSTGLIAVSVNDDGFSNSTYNFPKCNGYSEQRYVAGCPGDSTVSVPIPVSLAATACNYWSSPNFNLMFY